MPTHHFLIAGSILACAAAAQIPCRETNLGTRIALGDDAFSAAVPLGFTFTYGGVGYTDVQVCSNGYVVLGNGVPGAADYSPTVYELVNNPVARIAVLWADLSPQLAGSGGVWVRAVPASGSTPAYFALTYDACYQYATTVPVTAQLLLVDGGEMQFYYGEDVRNCESSWVVGASPGNGATVNPTDFATLPIATSGNATLHHNGRNALSERMADQVFRWTPDGIGGYIVTNGPGCAENLPYGSGCVARYASFYEHFANTTSFDLSNAALSAQMAGNGYIVTQGLTAFVPPSGSAVNLGLADDAETIVTLSQPLLYPGGNTSIVTVCSNGFVSTGSNGTGYQPDEAALLARANPSWNVWHDFNISATGVDNVYFEEQNGIAYFTWSNCHGYQGTAQGPVPSTFQFQFELATGTFHIVFQGMDTSSLSGYTGGDGYLVGWSPGGFANDPGNADLSTVATGAAILRVDAVDGVPLGLKASARPVIGTTVQLVMTDLTPTAPFGGLIYGFTRYTPGVSLSTFGMPGCFQYNNQLAVLLVVPVGASTVSVPFTVPNVPGVVLQAQAVLYDPAAGLTPLGATASRGVALQLGN